MTVRTSREALRLAVLTRGVFPLHGVGGLERHVFDLLRHHLDDGLQVHLVTRPPSDAAALRHEAWTDIAARPGTSVEFVPYYSFPFAGRRGTTVIDRSTAYPLFGWRAGRRVARAVARGDIDMVYGLGASTWGYARARLAGAPAPFVMNPQGLEEFGGTDPSFGGSRMKQVGYGPLRGVVQACADAADVVIATDQVLEPVVARHLHVGRERLRVVPNGIDIARCDALASRDDGQRVRAGAGIPGTDILLLSAGRIERNKGFHVLARALAGWNPGGAWTWAIAGDGPYRGDVEREVASLGLAARVRWVGRVSDEQLHGWYEAADLFVHPTIYEGSSLVTLEAMAHRKPVAATRAGGLPDKVIDGESGWLAEPASPEALRHALDRALDARDRWRTMGEAGRTLAVARFAWPVIARQLADLYRELLMRGAR